MSTITLSGLNPDRNNKLLKGDLRIPSSKSHTIRALLIASFADSPSRILDPLYSEDTKSCLNACRLLGADIKEHEWGWDVLKPVDTRANQSALKIDTGNSGTTLYLITAMAAILDRRVDFDGDDQIRSRSASNLLDALKDLGVQVESSENGCAPYSVCGPMKSGETSIECPTSQYLSALLLALPLLRSQKISRVHVPLLMEKPYVEMTLKWMADQGIVLENRNYRDFLIRGNQSYKGFEKKIPSDFSSATFFLCAAAITGSDLRFKGLDMNDTQGDKQVIPMLEKMGCSYRMEREDLLFSGGVLRGSVLDLNDTPDALPALAATACYASSETRIVNVPQARMKETDRIAVMTTELRKMGAQIEELPDGMIIRPSKLKGSSVNGHGDHRIVMALAIASLMAEGETRISTKETVDITFPGFFDLLNSLKQ
ncbi:MAG: 3-phosphoshikimate 1-carboxyvinyltransferase [Spirochaetaceae bacterium 4572_59]|nr:MAG: 3-phosphoshikimate 1-carboxyvinyltransferase [Spirochaetaceae bacterium 4572_59]